MKMGRNNRKKGMEDVRLQAETAIWRGTWVYTALDVEPKSRGTRGGRARGVRTDLSTRDRGDVSPHFNTVTMQINSQDGSASGSKQV